jgi:hypothetical protein
MAKDSLAAEESVTGSPASLCYPLTCDHCGRPHANAIDRPDAIRIECMACGSVDWIWKDNEYDECGSDVDSDT